MTKHSIGWVTAQKRWLLAFLVMLSASTVIAFFIRAAFDNCDCSGLDVVDKRVPLGAPIGTSPSPPQLHEVQASAVGLPSALALLCFETQVQNLEKIRISETQVHEVHEVTPPKLGAAYPVVIKTCFCSPRFHHKSTWVNDGYPRFHHKST